jgi:O-antigen/teichoic acid export membrane protein
MPILWKGKIIGSNEFRDSFYLILLQGVNQLLPLIVMPYLMIKLGTYGYGHVGYSLSVIQYMIIIVDFGFNFSATKKIAIVGDNRVKRSRIFWATVAAKTFLLTIAMLIMLILITCVGTFRLYRTAIIATVPMLIGSTYTFMWLYQGIGKIRLFSILNTISKITLLPLIFIYVKTPDDYVVAAFLQSAVFLFTAIASGIHIYYKKWIIKQRPTMRDIKNEISDSFPLFLSSASTSVYTQLTVVIIGFFCATETVGLYTSAERIMRAACFVLYTPLSQVYFPKISALASKNRAEAKNMFKRAKIIIMSVMTLVCVALLVCGKWGPVILGSDYNGIDKYLTIFAFVPFAIGFGGIYGQMGLIALGNKYTIRSFRNTYFTAAVFSICATLSVTPIFYAYGACFVTAATEIIVALLMYYKYKKHILLCSY